MTTDLPRCGEVVGFDSDAHTITLRVETMPDGLAIGDRLHGPRLDPELVEALEYWANWLASHGYHGPEEDIRAALAALGEVKP